MYTRFACHMLDKKSPFHVMIKFFRMEDPLTDNGQRLRRSWDVGGSVTTSVGLP